MELPEPIQIPDTYDTVTQKAYLREYAQMHFPLVQLKRLDRVTTVVDELYNEAQDKRYLAPISLRCYIDHDPSKKTLTHYGLDQSRKVLFMVPTVFLSDLGILGKDDSYLIGDLLLWGGDVYEIKDQVKNTDSFWANTNIPLYLVLSGDYYREGV